MRSAFILAIVTLVLVSCSVTRDWQSNEEPGRFKASYSYFNNKYRKEVTLSRGDLLFIDYRITVTAGRLKMEVRDGGKVLWQKQLEGSGDSASFHIPAPDGGRCTIVVSGEKAAGSFDVHYDVARPKRIAVKTSRNIELFGLMLQLDNGGDFLANKDTTVIDGKRTTWAQWNALAVRNYLQFKKFDSCEMMVMYRKLTGEGVFFDALVNLLLQVEEAPLAKINALTDQESINAFSTRHDTVEALRKANAFLEAVNKFYREVDLDAYLTRNRQYYEIAVASVTKNIPAGDFLPVMEHYYRKQSSNYCFVPGPNILTSMGFGKSHQHAHTIYNTFGPFSFQSLDSNPPDPGFDYPERIKALSVHEFGHSFSNPAIDRLPAELIASTRHLYDPIAKQMKGMAYPSWTTSLYEHFVRAGEVIIAEKSGDTARARKMIDDNVRTGFIYLPFIVSELRTWDKAYAIDVSYEDAVLSTMKKLDERYRR